MASIKELYPDKWLRAEHLKKGAPVVTIERAVVEKLFNPRTNKTESKLVLSFHGKALRLIMNKTQSFAVADIAGEDYTRWSGHQVVLSTATAPNGQATILISPVPDAPAADKKEVAQ